VGRPADLHPAETMIGFDPWRFDQGDGDGGRHPRRAAGVLGLVTSAALGGEVGTPDLGGPQLGLRRRQGRAPRLPAPRRHAPRPRRLPTAQGPNAGQANLDGRRTRRRRDARGHAAPHAGVAPIGRQHGHAQRQARHGRGTATRTGTATNRAPTRSGERPGQRDIRWSRLGESNPRPTHCECVLPGSRTFAHVQIPCFTGTRTLPRDVVKCPARKDANAGREPARPAVQLRFPPSKSR
jgi:hypothetical protein